MILFSLSFKGKCEVNCSDVTTLGLDSLGKAVQIMNVIVRKKLTCVSLTMKAESL